MTKTFIKFGIVGGSGLIVNMLAFSILTNHLRIHHLVAGALATEIAILNNFTWNHLWTFRRRGRIKLSYRLVIFHGSRILGLLVTVGSLFLLADIIGLNLMVSYLLAIGLGVVTNFLTSDIFVWPES